LPDSSRQAGPDGTGEQATFGFGVRHPAVLEIRERLARVGLLREESAPTDPLHFDQELARAVAAFQQQRGLVVDGIVGRETYRRLEEARWRLGDREVAYTSGKLAAGDDVADLQRRLSGLGFDCGRVDGLFGPATDRALREFQGAVGLSADGRCGSASVRALQRLHRTVAGGSGSLLREGVAHARLRSGIQNKIIVLDMGPDDAPHAGLVREVVRRVEGSLAAVGSTVLLGPATSAGEPADHDRAAAQFANEVNAHIVVSPRVAVAPSARVHGAAAYYFGGVHGVSHLGCELAAAVHSRLVALPGVADCGTHAQGWPILRYTRMPCTSVELGYASNPADLDRLTTAGAALALAGALAQGLADFFQPTDG